MADEEMVPPSSSANDAKLTDKLVSDKNKVRKYSDEKNVAVDVNDNENNNADPDANADPSDPNPNTDINPNTNTRAQPKDEFYSAKAHRFRRIWHVVTFLCAPFLYLFVAKPFADAIGLSLAKLIAILILISIIAELIRLRFKFIIFGMREYERHHFCAQFWGTVSALIVWYLAFPRAYSIAPVISVDANGRSTGSEAAICFGQIMIPLLWTLGIGDPLLGELKGCVRRQQLHAYMMYLIAEVVIVLIWVICVLWCGTPWWLVLIIPPIAIIAEKPSIPHIDDNGLMLLVPLLFCLVFEPWFVTSCRQVFYQ